MPLKPFKNFKTRQNFTDMPDEEYFTAHCMICTLT